MTENRLGDGLEVVRQHVVAFMQRGSGFGRHEKHDAGPRTGPELNLQILASGAHDPRQVAQELLPDRPRTNLVLSNKQLLLTPDALQVESAEILKTHPLLVGPQD